MDTIAPPSATFQEAAPPAADWSLPGTWRDVSLRERYTFLILAALSLLVRAVAFFRYRFDSDEPQHLHVVWGWSTGRVQYRDLFDNHAPLFHMLMSPFMRLIAERPDILLYMRALMLPFFACSLLAAYKIGQRLYNQRVGLWSALLLSVFPPFFLKSLEFRTDNLWTALWAVVLIVMVGKPLSPKRLFMAGLLLGAALCVSLKTPLLIATLSIAGIATYVLCDVEWKLRPMITAAIAALAGIAIVPFIVSLLLRSLGVWREFVYCTVTFNALISETRYYLWVPRALYPITLTSLLWLARRRAAKRVIEGQRRWTFFLSTALGVYTVTLAGFWILISTRDFLPLMPIALALLVGRLDRRSDSSAHFGRLTSALVASMFLFILSWTNMLHDGTAEHISMMRQVLGVTKPGEPLLDYKGETIYRQRPFYYILEYMTRMEMRAGLIRDTIPESIISAQCHVVQADGDFWPPRGRTFLSHHFLDIGRLRVSGQWISLDGHFSIAVPGEYVMVTSDGPVAGTLDGHAGWRAGHLNSGPHRFLHPLDGKMRVACFWAPASQRGYSPFHFRDRDF